MQSFVFCVPGLLFSATMDDAAPAHVRVQPTWVAELASVAKEVFPVTITGAIKNVLARKGSFSYTAPIWVCRSTSSSELVVASLARSVSLSISRLPMFDLTSLDRLCDELGLRRETLATGIQ